MVMERLDADVIADFEAGIDHIALVEDGFPAFSFQADPSGTALPSAHFVANATGQAADSDDFIVYDTDSGNIFYDADGNGSGAALHVTTVAAGLALAAGDFLVVPSFG